METIFDACVDAHTSHDEVTGPKVDLKQCSLCGQLVSGGLMVVHLIDHHAEEIINNREIF